LCHGFCSLHINIILCWKLLHALIPGVVLATPCAVNLVQ
jgi:hypothetical protein